MEWQLRFGRKPNPFPDRPKSNGNRKPFANYSKINPELELPEVKMDLQRILILLVWVSVSGQIATGQAPKKPTAAPKSLLNYYGWPSCINGASEADGPNSINAAVAEIAKYKFVVLGGGIENQKHGDHLKTKAIVGAVKDTRFFGYIPLGNRKGVDPCLEMKEIQTQIRGWAAMGVKGVLLDEFGFDYAVTRDRQNDAVDAAHKANLAVIANAWDPDHVFLLDAAGLKSTLKSDSDIYLWESYRFVKGKPVDLADWRAKAEKSRKGGKSCRY